MTVFSTPMSSPHHSPLRRALNTPRRVVDEWIRMRQRQLWKQIANGFARPFLDRWGHFREPREDGINRLRSIAELPPLLKYRPGLVPAELWSPRRLNHLIRELHLRSYLEIGVFEGETFANVEVRRRCGVDPDPLFDPVLLPRGSKFAVMTSDAFFAMIRPSKHFDVAFIDGLHTVEQTYRDLINTFAHLRGGVVLIDDTVPSDEYSAIPDQARVVPGARRGGPRRTTVARRRVASRVATRSTSSRVGVAHHRRRWQSADTRMASPTRCRSVGHVG